MKLFSPAIGASILSLTACISMDTYENAEKGHMAAQKTIETAPNYEAVAAVYVTEPPLELAPIKRPEGPAWLNRKVAEPLELASLPFDLAVDEVLKDTGVSPKFSYDLQSSLPVSLVHEGTVRGALDKLAARTNYVYTVTDNTIEWRAYVIENFTIPGHGGDYSYLIGKDGESESNNTSDNQSGNSIDTSAFDVDRRQYSRIKAEELNVFGDVEQSLRHIVGKFGWIVPSPSSSSVMVKTTPDRMQLVSEYMTNLLAQLTNQVLLELKVVQVTTMGGADAGLSWAALKQTTRSELIFAGEPSSSIFTESIPVAFSSNRTTGKGSVDILIKAMEEQGQVSFVTEQRVLSISGKVAELELAGIEGYLARSQVTNTTEVGSTQELIPGIIQDGYSIYAMTKVFGEHVAMAISTRSSDLEPFKQVGTEDNFIQLPSMRSNRLNIQQIVRSGTTVIAAAVRREEASSSKHSPINARLAPTYAGAERVVTDLYMLITPRIVTDV